MALSEVTVTLNVHDYVGDDFDLRRTKLWTTNNIPDGAIHDLTTGETRVGSGRATIAADGSASITVWAPGGVDSNPSSWQSYINLDYPDAASATGRGLRVFGPFTITADALLTDLVAEQEVPAEYLTTVTALLDGYVDDASAAATTAGSEADRAEAAADLAHDISGIATPDALVATLVGDSGSDTATALTASYVQVLEAPVSPYRFGLTDDMEGDPAAEPDVTAAFQAALDSLPTQSGAVLYPRGEWFCSGLVTSGRGFAIMGHGMQSTLLRLVDHAGDAEDAAPMIHVLADTAPHYGAGTISDMTIGLSNSTGPIPNPGPCVRVEGAHAADVILKNMWLGGGSNGVEFLDAPNCAMLGVVIETCQACAVYADGASDLSLTDVEAWQNNAHGMEFANCDGVLLLGGKVLESYHHGVRAVNSSNVGIVGTLFDNNSKDYSSAPEDHINYNLYDNIHFEGVNEGQIVGTQHVCTLGYAFTRKAIDIDAASYHVDVLGGTFPGANFRTDDISNASTGGQTLTRGKFIRSAHADFQDTISVGGLWLRNNAGVLEKSTNFGSSWAAV
jgi:hypothetical protein